jgi:tRNA pseudouridine38-40 synthase
MPSDLPLAGRTGGERYQAVLAYDGTGFEGFEAQPKRRTVQGEVEAALRKLGWADRRILAGGRTDSGVHAAGQVIAFDLEWRHGPHALQAAMNTGLPPDISVRKLEHAGKDFHPRYDAIRRCYRYTVVIDEWPDPLREHQAYRVWPEVRLDRMQEAAALLIGPHDFGAFGTAPRAGGHTRRRVDRA